MSWSYINEGGSILLTTPYYYDTDKIWKTDLPPIHRFWFSERSFKFISQNLSLDVNFIFPDKSCYDFNPSNHSNLLAIYIMDKFTSNGLPTSILTNDLKGCVRSNYNNHVFTRVIKTFATSKPVRYFSNKIYLKFIHEQPKSFAITLKGKS